MTYQSEVEEEQGGRRGEKEREVVVRGANEKINTQAAFQYLAKQPDIACCSVIGGRRNIMGIIHRLSGEKAAWLRCVM